MFRSFLVILTVFACSIEEETSDLNSMSEWGDKIDRAPAPIERADVNEDGVVNVLDLTAVSYWHGEQVADWVARERQQLVERNVRSEIQANAEIEIGKPFEVSVWASLDGGLRIARDFYVDGERDYSCNITAELFGVDANGEIVSDAIVGFQSQTDSDGVSPGFGIGQQAFQTGKWRNGQGYGTFLTGFFTASAQQNGVEKIVVKSGSTCGGQEYRIENGKRRKERVTPMVEVKQIPVNIVPNRDDLDIKAELLGSTLRLSMAHDPGLSQALIYGSNAEERKNTDETTHIALQVVDASGIVQGVYSSIRGTYSPVSQGFRWWGLGTQDNGRFLYDITSFARLAGGFDENGRFHYVTCDEGASVVVLIQQLHKVRRSGELLVPKKGSTNVYTGSCRRSY